MTKVDPSCSHQAARVDALLVAGSADVPLTWGRLDNPDGDPEPIERLDAYRTAVYLGTCGDCHQVVVTVRTWEDDNWSADHGRAMSTPWTAFRPG